MKKLETVFSVFLVGVLLLPSFSFGAWTGPTGSFSIDSPDPALPIDEGSLPQSKDASLLLPQLRLEDLGKLDSLKLEPGSGISWGVSSLSFNSRNLFNFIGEGIKLPSLGEPSLPVAGTIYYDSTAKEVKLYDGADWKSIGSGATSGNTNPFLLTYTDPGYLPTIQNWSLTAKPQSGVIPTKGPILEFTNTENNQVPVVSIEDKGPDYGSRSLLLNTGTRLCFNNGKVPATDCKSAWPVIPVGNQSSTFTEPVTIDLSTKTGGSAARDVIKLRSGNDGVNNDMVAILGLNRPKVGFWSGDESSFGGAGTNSWATLTAGAGEFYGQINSVINSPEGGALSLQNNTKTGATANNWKLYNMTGGYGNGLAFWRYFADGTNPGPTMFLADNGNVGVGGIPDDKYKFDVKSGYINLGDAGSEVFIPGGGTLDRGLAIRSGGLVVDAKDENGNAQAAPISAIKILGPNQPADSNSAQDIRWDFNTAGSAVVRAYRGGSWDTNLQFLTNPAIPESNNPQVRMTINSDGNVGIGTDNPTKKLDINGGGLSIKSGSIYFESPEFNKAPVLAGATGIPGGNLPAGNYFYAITYGGVDGGGETQTSGFTNIGVAISSGSGTAQFDITEPSDNRIGSFYIYRSNSGSISETYKRVGIWNLPKNTGDKTVIGNGTLEKTSSGYRFTDSGLPLGSAGLPPYPTFSAGFFLKSENESAYKPMLNFIRQSGDNRSFMGINTDRPSQMLEILGVGSVSSASASNKIEDATDGITARVRITDTIHNPELQLQYGTTSNDHWGIYADSSNSSLNIWGYDKDILKISKDKGIKVDTNAFWNGYTWLPNGWTVSCTAAGTGSGQPSMNAKLYVKDGLMYYSVRKGESEVSNGTWASWDYIANNAGRVRGARAELVNITGPAAGHNNWAFYAEMRWDGIYISTAAWKKRSSQMDPFGGMLTPGPSLQVATFNSGSDSGHIGTYKHCGVDFLGNSNTW